MTKFLPDTHPYKKWYELRKRQDQENKVSSKNCILFACASAGEYEAVRQLSKQLQSEGELIHLMFFSASGYEYARQHANYDELSYSPVDTTWEVNTYLRQHQPKAVIISSNNFWPIFLQEIQWHKIPYICIDVRLHPSKSRILYNHWLNKHLRKAVLVTTYCSYTLRALQTNNIEVINTPPFRLGSIYDQEKIILPEVLKSFVNTTDQLIIYGSTHQEDLDLLAHIPLPQKTRLIIAPHHVDKDSIDHTLTHFKSAVLLSKVIENIDSKVLIIDSIGLLKHLYQYADKVYIGGGFKQGIHSILEPAVYGIPIAFGPVHRKFPEAQMLIDVELGTVVNNSKEIQHWIDQNRSIDRTISDVWSKQELDRICTTVVEKIRKC